MHESETILVVIDPTAQTQPGLAQAAVLAGKLGKALELFICTHGESLINYHHILGDETLTSVKQQCFDIYEEQLHNLAEPLRGHGLKVTHEVCWDRPLDEGIIRKAMRSKPFLIVKDTHYHKKLLRAIFKNTDWGLIRACPCPVLFVKQQQVVRQPRAWAQPKIISAVNPVNEQETRMDQQILELGKRLSFAMQGEHKVMHVFHPLSVSFVGFTGAMPSVDTYLENYNEQILKLHQDRLNQLMDEQQLNRDQAIFEQGDVRQLLPDIVDNQQVDLVIMGSISKSRVEQAFIGGTAEAVIDDIHCDVLVMKPDSFVTPVSPEPAQDHPYTGFPV